MSSTSPEPTELSESSSGAILVVDSSSELDETLRDLGYDTERIAEASAAVDSLRGREFDAVLLDVSAADEGSGLEVCHSMTSVWPDVPVVVMTESERMETAIGAIRAGAYDYVRKPISIEALNITLARAVKRRGLRRRLKLLTDEIESLRGLDGFIGRSAAMQRVYRLIAQVAPTDSTVLISGESGTGKELVARAIHNRSHRAAHPFIAINCAAVPANLLESELFGHVKGAFTDAKASRSGLLVQASGGTLLLDEIGEMPLDMQSKLLRVLQERKARPVGGDHEVSFDARIIAATHRDLEQDVRSGKFREDLYYRINVVQIKVPPLRARGNDILLLAEHFLQSVAQSSHRPRKELSPEAARKLLDYDWPGNVRELQNAVEQATALASGSELQRGDLPPAIRNFNSTQLRWSQETPTSMPSLEQVEQAYIQQVLAAVGGNKTHAARVLNLDRRTLYRRLKRLERDRDGSVDSRPH